MAVLVVELIAALIDIRPLVTDGAVWNAFDGLNDLNRFNLWVASNDLKRFFASDRGFEKMDKFV